jgi:hypothetical protein
MKMVNMKMVVHESISYINIYMDAIGILKGDMNV